MDQDVSVSRITPKWKSFLYIDQILKRRAGDIHLSRPVVVTLFRNIVAVIEKNSVGSQTYFDFKLGSKFSVGGDISS